MLLPVMRHIANFFEIYSETGEFEIKNGSIAVDEYYVVGQYVAISGSILNNGVKRVERFEDGVISFTIPRDEYPAWVLPTGTIGLYSAGDRVTHNGERWISLVDNNSWEPGAIGTASLWERIPDSPEEHTTVNEVFYGTIYGLQVPPDFIALCDEIQIFSKKNAPTGKTSESFGSYSYSRATDASGAVISWEKQFRERLIPFRSKMFTGVYI